MKNINTLVTAICFINRSKPGAEIYATFANRLLDDVMTKTPYDFRLITNEIEHFTNNQIKYSDRVILVEDKLENDKISIGVFNQLLKYKTMLGVDKKYDWLLYLDCDAGFIDTLDIDFVEYNTKQWESLGYDFMATRTNAILKEELSRYEEQKKEFHKKYPDQIFLPSHHESTLFSKKFIFYNVSSENGPFEWMNAKLPSEHIWYIKNNEKLEIMGNHFKVFNDKFQQQDPFNPITVDMEAFEVGVSAELAGYNIGELGSYGHHDVLKVGFNLNNWEKVKY